MATQQQTDLGFDVAYDVTTVDMYKVDSLVTGNQLVGQRIARMLFTPHGALANIDPDPSAGNWGWDCRQYLNAKFSQAQQNQAISQVENAVLQDEEVQNCSVQFNFGRETGKLSISLTITTANGPFQLVLDVNDVSAQIVFNSGFNQ